MKKMLINATHKEEVRIALVQDNELVDLDIEQKNNTNKKSNIYNGQISRVEPSLEACFVNYGHNRDGFLPFKDIDPSYYDHNPDKFKEKITPGKKLIVQVTREERGNKGAALTTQISLASTFLVLMPMSDKQEGISRRLSAEERDALRRKIQAIDKKDGKGIIVRTAGTGCSQEELAHDLRILNYIWEKIQEYAKTQDKVGILHHESETIIRVLRDYLTKDVDEIVTDSKDAYEKAEHYLNLVRPQSKPKVSLYQDENQDLFRYYRIEDQINTAFQRKVSLKSGGELVIDTTEALTSIDVNSSKSTSGSDIEQTAYTTNMEAAEEIARQLKIRDLGGLIVIDFIDMNKKTNIKNIEESMRNLTKDDRARIQTAPISKFGLMEISRQRIRGSIAESNNHICPRCSGTGFIRDNESLALHILREMSKEVSKPGKAIKLHLVTPVEIATFLNNEKRQDISEFEERNRVEVNIISDPQMVTPHFGIYRVRKGDNNYKDLASYQLADYYREQEKSSTKNNRKNKDSIHEHLHHSTSSVPDEYEDKTFEARLEKADFLKNVDNKKAPYTGIFSKALCWIKSLWTKKETKEDPKEKVVSNSVEEKTPRRRANKKRTRKQKRTDNNAEAIATTESKAKDSIVTKEVTSGSVVETIVSKPSRRRSKKQAIIQDDINPQKVKAELDAKESTEYRESKESKEVASHKEAKSHKDLKVVAEQELADLNQGKDSTELKDSVNQPITDKPRLSKAEKRRLKREKQALEAEYDYSLKEENNNSSKNTKAENQDSSSSKNDTQNKNNKVSVVSKDSKPAVTKAESTELKRKGRERNRSRRNNRSSQEIESYNYLLQSIDFPINQETFEAWAQDDITQPITKEVSLAVNLETGIPTYKKVAIQEPRSERKKSVVSIGTLNSPDFKVAIETVSALEKTEDNNPTETIIKNNKEVPVIVEPQPKALEAKAQTLDTKATTVTVEHGNYRRPVFKAPQPCVNFHDKKHFENANRLRQRNVSKRKEQDSINKRVTKTAKGSIKAEQTSIISTDKAPVKSTVNLSKDSKASNSDVSNSSPAYRGYLSGSNSSATKIAYPKINKVELEDLKEATSNSLNTILDKEGTEITKTAKAIATVSSSGEFGSFENNLNLDSNEEKEKGKVPFLNLQRGNLFPKK